MRILCSYFSLTFVVAKRALLFKYKKVWLFHFLKLRIWNFISDNLFHSNASGDILNRTRKRFSKYWMTQKSKFILQVKFCSIFPGLTCCFGSKLRMQKFYSNRMSSEISSNSSLFWYTNKGNLERNTCAHRG